MYQIDPTLAICSSRHLHCLLVRYGDCQAHDLAALCIIAVVVRVVLLDLMDGPDVLLHRGLAVHHIPAGVHQVEDCDDFTLVEEHALFLKKGLR